MLINLLFLIPCKVTHLYLHSTYLEWENKRQHTYHYQSHNNLQRQSHLDVVHKRVAACLHHECVGRSREWRGKAHACSKRNGKEHRVGTYAYCRSRGQGYRRHKHSCGCIADEHRKERRGEVDARLA